MSRIVIPFHVMTVCGSNSGFFLRNVHTVWKLVNLFKKRKSIPRLPPDNDSLELHCMRANYLAYIQKNYSLKDHRSPIGYGWQLIDGKCRTLRFRFPELPDTLAADNS